MENVYFCNSEPIDLNAISLASTIFEEWLHRDKQMADESRDLQNFLFEKLFSMTARLCAMEAK